jgi:gliding-associated putative ABC transporter substrate-binding component GldG
MVNLKSKKLGDILVLANGLVAIILINVLATNYFFRIDLTEEKRYSIKQPTKEILKTVDDDVYIEVYLEGDLNAGFKRFQKSIKETLEEFRIYSNNKVHYIFTNPSTAMSQKARSEFMSELASKGIQPTNVIDNKGGQRSEKIIFPGALISYGGFESGVMLLKGNKANTPEEEINQSIEGVEYELANAIYKLVNTDRKQIAFISGHRELDSLELAGFNNVLSEVYDVFKINLNSVDIKKYDALILAKPQTAFSVEEKYNLDQYIMNGGKVLFLLDKLEASMDSASQESYFAFPYDLDLDDLLFKYGVRINLDLIQDRTAGLYPVVTGETGGKPKLQLMDWPFFPLINHYADHPVTRNLDAVVTRFTSSIDTVKAVRIKKTPLLMTSQFSRTISAPVNVSINELRKNVKKEDDTKSFIPVGYLLEGEFSSLFKNRFLPEGVDRKSFRKDGSSTKLIVIADGDIARNDVNPRTNQPQPLGYDPFTQYTFANQDLLMNALAYLTNGNGLIAARNKEVKIRPLDKDKIQSEKLKWQMLNLVVPILLICLFGILKMAIRKKKFASF